MKTKVTEYNIIGIDPTRFLADGIGYWRDEDGKVFKDAVLLLHSKEDAYYCALSCGQICFLHVSLEKKPNGYLMELPEAELNRLFQEGKITGYTVLGGRGADKGVPQTFTVLSNEEAKMFDKQQLVPIYYEFVYVNLP